MMKTRLLFTLLLSIVFTFAYSQSLVLSYGGETLEPNAEVVVEGSAYDPEIVAYLDVTNTSSSNIDIRVQRYEEQMVSGTASYFCWGLCYNANVSLSLVTVNVPAGTTNTVDFSAHYSANSISGQSTISFTFFDDVNPNDSVMVTFLFTGMITDVNENEMENIRAYPVPANNQLTIDLPDYISTGTTIEIVNINGEVVKTVQNSGLQVRINTGDLANGMYIYRIADGTQFIASERFVVQH